MHRLAAIASVFRCAPFGPPENGHVPNARFEVLIRAYERENRRLEDGGKPGLFSRAFSFGEPLRFRGLNQDT